MKAIVYYDDQYNSSTQGFHPVDQAYSAERVPDRQI